MKVAVFHNYMDNLGGAERVVLTLARDLPADVYSTNINRARIKDMGFKNISLNSIGRIPVNAPLRQQAALWRFHHLNLKDKYDYYIIAGDWAMSGVMNHKNNLSYIHSPIRQIWDLYEYTRQHHISPIKRPLFDAWVVYNRYLCRKYIKYSNKIVCNSMNTKERIRRYLRRDATVINPPIETSKFSYKKTGDYWLSVNRILNYKRVDMQMKAFAKMPEEKLVVVGCYEKSTHFQPYVNYVQKIKPDNVALLKSVPFDDLTRLYSNCKGFITTSKNEDFGIAPVEAMASGKPVIAPDEGGYKETVVDGVTGKLIEDIDVDKLVEAVKEVGKNPRSYKNDCLNQAKKFDSKVFIKKIREKIEDD